mgnify:CR=1 FL=1
MSKGRFGQYGGQYIPETLMNAVQEVEEAYERCKNDPEFVKELDELYRNYAGRPSMLYYAEKMTGDLGGAKIYLKRLRRILGSQPARKKIRRQLPSPAGEKPIRPDNFVPAEALAASSVFTGTKGIKQQIIRREIRRFCDILRCPYAHRPDYGLPCALPETHCILGRR